MCRRLLALRVEGSAASPAERLQAEAALRDLEPVLIEHYIGEPLVLDDGVSSRSATSESSVPCSEIHSLNPAEQHCSGCWDWFCNWHLFACAVCTQGALLLHMLLATESHLCALEAGRGMRCCS